jgi:hypothetical protein
LGSDPDPEDIASWLGAAFGPPVITNREGEDTLMCRAVLRPSLTSWDEVAASLDALFGKDEDGGWAEKFHFNDEVIVRCFLRREGDDLVVETNSAPRFDRLLGTLREQIAGDLEVVEEERLTLSELQARSRAGDSSVGPAAGPMDLEAMPPEVASAMEDLIRKQEAAWLDDHIPALGGRTPREGADDPTRRQDLVALLNQFDSYGEAPPGAMTFDISRLRHVLGLSSE